MNYTRTQLETQRQRAKEALANERLMKEAVQSPEWMMAKTYGEEVRVQWLNRINNSIDHYQKKVIDLSLKLLENVG